MCHMVSAKGSLNPRVMFSCTQDFRIPIAHLIHMHGICIQSEYVYHATSPVLLNKIVAKDQRIFANFTPLSGKRDTKAHGTLNKKMGNIPKRAKAGSLPSVTAIFFILVIGDVVGAEFAAGRAAVGVRADGQGGP